MTDDWADRVSTLLKEAAPAVDQPVSMSAILARRRRYRVQRTLTPVLAAVVVAALAFSIAALAPAHRRDETPAAPTVTPGGVVTTHIGSWTFPHPAAWTWVPGLDEGVVTLPPDDLLGSLVARPTGSCSPPPLASPTQSCPHPAYGLVITARLIARTSGVSNGTPIGTTIDGQPAGIEGPIPTPDTGCDIGTIYERRAVYQTYPVELLMTACLRTRDEADIDAMRTMFLSAKYEPSRGSNVEDMQVAELWATALRQAAAAGDTQPVTQASAVETTDGAAEAYLNFGSDPQYAGTQVWVIQIPGSFVCKGSCHDLRTAVTGRVLTLILGTKTQLPSSFGIADKLYDLSRLGKVIALHP